MFRHLHQILRCTDPSNMGLQTQKKIPQARECLVVLGYAICSKATTESIPLHNLTLLTSPHYDIDPGLEGFSRLALHPKRLRAEDLDPFLPARPHAAPPCTPRLRFPHVRHPAEHLAASSLLVSPPLHAHANVRSHKHPGCFVCR
jgi:hypothetical protein